MACDYCGNPKSEFTCPECGAEFCPQHVLSTEVFYCKKCKLDFDYQRALDVGFRCNGAPKSTCPSCGSELEVDRLPAGQFYLKCTDPKCGWDSVANRPMVLAATTNLALREGYRRGWIRKPKICDQSLKLRAGIKVCPTCLIKFVQNAGLVSFATIANRFNVQEPEKVEGLLAQLLDDRRLYGVLDSTKKVFLAISDQTRTEILRAIRDTGRVELAKYAGALDLEVGQVKDLTTDITEMNGITGTFSTDDSIFYTGTYAEAELRKVIAHEGRATLEELADKFKFPVDKIKKMCINLMKSTQDWAKFADKANEIVTVEKLENELAAFAKTTGKFKLEDAEAKFNVTHEIVRSAIHSLVKDGKLRGRFTQRGEYVTEKFLREKIKEFSKAYRKIKLYDLARKLAVTEMTVEEILTSLIASGAIHGYMDMTNRTLVVERVDARRPVASVPGPGSGAATTSPSEGEVEVVREYDFVGGQLHFKVAVRNFTPMAIHDVKVVLDVPDSYRLEREIITVPVIDPGNSRGVDFYLEPESCGISSIGGTVIYKDAHGTSHSVHVRSKEVQIKCPLVVKTLDSIEDCQLAINDMPSDARAFLIADLDPRLAFRAAMRAILNFDTRLVTSYESEDVIGAYEGEAWFSSKAKVTGGRIVIRVFVSGADQSLEIRVWCNNPGQLTGFLAKAIEILFTEINIIRKVRAEGREKTIDIMALTQNIMLVSNYCELRWKVADILVKLEDIQARLERNLESGHPALGRITSWIETLSAYEGEDIISEADAEKLVQAMETVQDLLARSIAPSM